MTTSKHRRLDSWRRRIPLGVMVAWQGVYVAIGRESDAWVWKALSVYAYTLIGVWGLLTARDAWRRRHEPRSPSSNVARSTRPRVYIDADGNRMPPPDGI